MKIEFVREINYKRDKIRSLLISYISKGGVNEVFVYSEFNSIVYSLTDITS